MKKLADRRRGAHRMLTIIALCEPINGCSSSAPFSRTHQLSIVDRNLSCDRRIGPTLNAPSERRRKLHLVSSAQPTFTWCRHAPGRGMVAQTHPASIWRRHSCSVVTADQSSALNPQVSTIPRAAWSASRIGLAPGNNVTYARAKCAMRTAPTPMQAPASIR